MHITSATVGVKWNAPIHTPSLLVYGYLPTKSRTYDGYAKCVSSGRMTLENAVSGYWGFCSKDCFTYFQNHTVLQSDSTSGFENGVSIRFHFGVARVFNSGKAIIAVTLTFVQKNEIEQKIKEYVSFVHDYIASIRRRYDSSLSNQNFPFWSIVSLNANGSLPTKSLYLDYVNKCANEITRALHEPEIHRGYMQIFVKCEDKENTVNLYHSGKYVVLGVKHVKDFDTIKIVLDDILQKYKLYEF